MAGVVWRASARAEFPHLFRVNIFKRDVGLIFVPLAEVSAPLIKLDFEAGVTVFLSAGQAVEQRK